MVQVWAAAPFSAYITSLVAAVLVTAVMETACFGAAVALLNFTLLSAGAAATVIVADFAAVVMPLPSTPLKDRTRSAPAVPKA